MSENLDKILEIENGEKEVKSKPVTDGFEFKTLHTIGKIISTVGWVILAIALIAFLRGILADLDGDERAYFIMGGLFGAIYSILTVAFGQLISCFVSIEKNTRIMSMKLLAKE